MGTNAQPQNQSSPRTARPFTTFNFRVRITVEGQELCAAAFSECDGLEMTMEPKTHREGGNNVTQYQLIGPVSYGQLTLKRGMTETFDLWNWFNRVTAPEGYSYRTDVYVDVLPSTVRGDEDARPDVVFHLQDCLPIKLRAPTLSAGEGGVAIEELQVAYERMESSIPQSGADGTGTTSA